MLQGGMLLIPEIDKLQMVLLEEGRLLTFEKSSLLVLLERKRSLTFVGSSLLVVLEKRMPLRFEERPFRC